MLRNYSIRLQLLFIGIIILLLLIGTVLWSYYRILDITYERNSEYTSELISTIKQNIAQTVDSVNRIMPNITYNETIQQYLMADNRLKQFELHGQIEPLLVNLQAMKQGIVGIVLLSTAGGGFYNCVNCENYIPFGDIPERAGSHFTGVYRYPFTNPMRSVVYIGAPVYDKRNLVPAGTRIGYAVIVLDAGAIAPQMGTMSDRIAGSFYVLDRHNVVMGAADAAHIGLPIAQVNAPLALRISPAQADPVEYRHNGDKYVVHTEYIGDIGGMAVSVIPVKELFRGLEEVQLLLIGIFGVLSVIMYLFYSAISRNILLPLRSFMTFIYGLRAKGLDNPNRRVALKGYAEISVMAKQFNSLLDEIDDLSGRLIASKTHIFELQLLRKQAELQFLKSQINPHFLYNTLETIKGIAYVKGVPEIREMTNSLACMFRYSIKGEETVMLKEELEIVEAYIRIQQIRFSDRFDVRFEIGEECLSRKVMKMMLQPLVENAVFHGIEPSLHRCKLTVGCMIGADNVMRLWIEDDGVGMNGETLERIRGSLAGKPPLHDTEHPGSRHIGLMNVNNRIKFACGGEYGITTIESAPNSGTRVFLTLPGGGLSHVSGHTG
ncbi:sensor histidine kinase [Paenibacillus oceani]|uniref:Sensor histidine kinase n=1 Tax=Paenibacillus oceani TaxID=2772510 RepID=A0A927C6V3_9BACL|nr:sensor histidine kinase [Paenibacillus oceani]MBD2862305.1 sensor histidine kinase [Paenibacillus oceani]